MKITRVQGNNGQGQCALCKKRGKWNVQWMSFLYKIDGKEGVYCNNCVNELKIQDMIKQRAEETPIEHYGPFPNRVNYNIESMGIGFRRTRKE